MAERENLPPGVRFKVLVRDNFKCVYCGKTKNEERIDVDHVIPVASGGTNDIGNLVAACTTCNMGKSKSHVIPVRDEDEGIYVRQPSAAKGEENVASPTAEAKKIRAPVYDDLKTAIRRSGLTHYLLGKKSGVAPSVIDRFMVDALGGQRGGDLRLSTAAKLAVALGLELRPSGFLGAVSSSAALKAVVGDEMVVRRGVAYESQLHADWGEVFRHCCFSVEYLATSKNDHATREVKELGYGDFPHMKSSILRIDFKCEMLNSITVGTVNVVILPNCDRGSFSLEQKIRLRDAVILGYREPTAIIIGSPWMFYGAVVNDRYKGSPGGFKLDGWLNRADDDIGYGWCPDETWKFADPRDEFSLKPTAIQFCGWHMTPAEGFALIESEAQHGL